jgi:signal transduction histidine kinase/CheY-like chemotaxis protein
VLGALLGATTLSGNDALCTHLVERSQGDAALAHRGAWVASSAGATEAGRPSSVGAPLPAEQSGALLRHARWAGPWTGPQDGRDAPPNQFMALGPLTNAGGEVVGAVAGLVSTSGLAALQLAARRSFYAAMGLGALVSLLLGLFAARRMAGPLRRLAQAATEMQKGRLDVPIAVEGDGEVAQLALALRETAAALAGSMSTLESRVEQRVHELKEAHAREAALNHELVAQNDQLRAQGQTLRAQGEELERQRGELVEKTRRSEEAERVKSAFIANMSHEIRTPLSSVLALSQLLRDGMAGALSVDQRRYLEVIERNGQNLLRLINDILDLSRIEAGHLEIDLQTVDLGAQIRSTVGTLVPLAEAKGLDLHARLPADLPSVRCDVDRVRQILTNLIGNAIKFTEAGQVEVTVDTSGDRVAVHVTDTGVGIPDVARAKVFEEFFQVDPSMARRQQGTGLGLAIASRLAHLMGGEISLESASASGSRFTLTLPRSVAEHEKPHAEVTIAAAALPSPSPSPPSPSSMLGPPRGGAVLIVEDNEDNLFALRQILNALSVEIATAASGREAIDHCRRRLPGLIVMDMQLPGMSGLQAAGVIRALPGGPSIPIIALTAQAMKGDRERILAAGCDEYLSKPIQPKVLLAAIQRLLPGRGEHLDGRGGALSAEEEEHGTHTPGR